jgi:hypothetical protein
LNNTNDGTAAILGAQQVSSSQASARLSSSNAGVAADSLSQNAGVNIRTASPPAPVTDGAGNPVSFGEFGEVINNAPPKLPGVGAGQDTLTDTQLAQLEDGRSAGDNNPTSSTNPSNQDIATDGG